MSERSTSSWPVEYFAVSGSTITLYPCAFSHASSSGNMRATSGRAGREMMAAVFDKDDEVELGMLEDRKKDCTEIDGENLNREGLPVVPLDCHPEQAFFAQ
jgi:hypothetical protein